MSDIDHLNVVKSENPEVIEVLGRLLEKAKKGELYSIVYCCEMPGGQMETGFSAGDLYPRLGGVSRMIHVLNRSMDTEIR